LQEEKVISFIRSLFKTDSFIPLHAPHFGGNEKKYLNVCIDSTYVSSVGQFVNTFENKLSEYTDAKHTIAVVNGTSAIHTALKVVGVQEGDEVITQALTFVATANAITYCNAKPVFIDVDKDTMGLSPAALKAFLNEYTVVKGGVCINTLTNKKIKACLPMHTFGFPCRIEEICEICDAFGIPVIEDAAEALGSELNGKKLGTFGTMGVFSFNGNKVITAGGGGAIVTNNLIFAEKAKHLTTTGKKKHPYEFFHDELAYNYRMPNINAALLCAQLEQLDNFLANKRILARSYDQFFNDLGIKVRTESDESKVNYWLICLELKNKEERDHYLNFLNENQIMTRPIWQLMYKLPMYKDCFRDHQKNAQFLEDRIINIPSSYRKNG
jgi:aminotransferase in exopolysaccharide biosynthesis